MLLLLLASFLSLITVCSAAVDAPVLLNESHSAPGNLSTAGFDIAASVNGSDTHSPIDVDPRFSYKSKFARLFLDKKSAYLNTVLALADLSTKGWTSRLSYAAPYSLARYGDATIRIHATQNPSSLEYRYAIWGLYYAIREASSVNFRACVLSLYWSPIVGGSSHLIGYVSIIGETTLGIGSDNLTEENLVLTPPKQASPPEPAMSSLTTTNNGSISIDTKDAVGRVLKVEMTLEGRPIAIDSVFYVVNTAIVYLSARPQSGYVKEPGLIKDDASRTWLHWDSTNLEAWPFMEYRHVIMALAKVTEFMYEQNRYEDARFIVYVDGPEVGRGWLHNLKGGTSNLE